MRAHLLQRLSVILLVLSFTAPPQASVMNDDLPSHESPEGDWPMYQHDAAHSGRTPATAYNNGPLYLQWAYSFGERVEVEAQPVIADDVIYQGVMNGEIHAINAGSGQARWVARPGGPIAHTGAVYGGRVYFGSLDGNIYALSALNGNVVWEFKTGGPVLSAPTIVDGRLYVGSNDGNLYALDATAGAELWRVATGGPVTSSPAVADGRVYFGSEDLTARCADAVTGHLLWATPLHGAGMRNTHPVVSDDGGVVMFLTVKPGGSSYVPLEGYPNAPQGANPVATWNAYYRAYPTRRVLYYLDADTGADLWNPTTLHYVPMPIPYWGLLHPILGPDAMAWFPAPAGTDGHDYGLDHDMRLFRTNLATGVTTQVATLAEFRPSGYEVGRHVFAGGDYYYAISEDLGVYRPDDGAKRVLFSNGDPSGYNFGTHMDPHSPLPSRHLWRYGGVIAMGGVPGASPPIVVNNMIYFTSYSWLYVLGPVNHGHDPASSSPARDARLHRLTYPRNKVPTVAEIRAEVERRVGDILALGPDAPPIAVRWDQAGDAMLHNEFTFEVYGFEGDLVRVLSEAYPHLPPVQQTQLRSYLSSLVANTLLNTAHYDHQRHCIWYGEGRVRAGDENCLVGDRIVSRWFADNPNLVGLRLYALRAYAEATGAWNVIEANWSLVAQQFDQFVDAYSPSLGFCDFEEWRTGRLNIGAQIAAAEAVRDMAARLGHISVEAQAETLLGDLLDSRVALAELVPDLYDTGHLQAAPIRLKSNGTINNEDIMGPQSPYNGELIPYDAALRNRETDPSQVNWWDGATYRVDAGIGFMHYPALSGYYPLSSSMIERVRAELLEKTRYYVKSYEVNTPWWWMSDLAHNTACGGEHLYQSPTLAWTMFQVKAWVLQEDWTTLAHQLPEPVSFGSRYDLYRLHNLVTLLSLAHPMGKRVSATSAEKEDVLTYTISLVGTGTMASITDTIPAGAAYVPTSARVEPHVGTLTVDSSTVRWTGILAANTDLQLVLAATVTADEPLAIVNRAVVDNGRESRELTAVTIANGKAIYLPTVLKE